MGSIGFCTAPNRLNAPTSTTDSTHVGNCHETIVPASQAEGVQPRGHHLDLLPVLPKRHLPSQLIHQEQGIRFSLSPSLNQWPQRMVVDQH